MAGKAQAPGTVNGEQKVRFELGQHAIAIRLRDALDEFLLDGKTGNVTLNVRDGIVMGLHLEEIVVAGRRI